MSRYKRDDISESPSYSKFVILFVILFVASGYLQAQQQPTLLKDRAQNFVMLFFDDNMDQAMADFDTSLTSRTSAQRLHFIQMSILQSLGPLKNIGQPEFIEGTVELTVIIPLLFEKGELEGCILFTGQGRISSFAFNPRGTGGVSKGPSYVDTEKFSEKDISIERPGLESLPGRLSVPKGKGPFLGIIMVQGAGPGGMDAGFGPNKPFKDLAHGLATQGIATLRFDRRSFAHPEWFTDRAYTIEDEVIEDVLVAIDMLRERPEINGSRIYLLGHSLGGMLAPRIARQAGPLSGLILLASPSRQLPTVIADQVEYMAGLDEPGMTPEQLEETRREIKAIANLKIEDSSSTIRVLGAPPAYWLDLGSYDQVAEAKAFNGPILFLQGNRDFQVTEEDLSGWERALGNRQNVTIQRFPSLNHLFMTGSGPSSFTEYTRQAGHMDEAVIKAISNWILN